VTVRIPLFQTIDDSKRKKKKAVEDAGPVMTREIGFLDIELNLQ
jgi:hypothetical protein